MATVSDLPEGIIELIGKKILSAEDFVRFGAVCKSLQTAVKFRKKNEKVSLSPWLMLATYDDDYHHKGGIQKFFSLANKMIFNLGLPETRGRRCFGTSFGWMVTIGIDLNIHLLDPFTNNQLSLPPQSTFGNQYKYKLKPKHLRNFFVHRFMAIQTGPDQSCVVIMAVHSVNQSLSFARPGDNAWTLVDSSRKGFKDVILYKGEFYAISSGGLVVVCDISDKAHPKAIDFAPPPEGIDDGNQLYLIEMNGGLHFVERVTSDSEKDGYTTDFFEVHEFDFCTKTWTYLDDLGDYALFLGTNTSYAIDTCKHPELKPNCVYYTDDHFDQVERKFYDMGMWDYGERKKEQIYSGDYIWSKLSRPIFIRPSL